MLWYGAPYSMKTDDLIAALSRPGDETPRGRHAWAWAAGLGLGVGLLLCVFTLGARPDLGEAIRPTLAKAAFSALFASAGLGLAMRLARPGRPAQMRWMLLAGLLGVSATAAGVAFVMTDPTERMHVWFGGSFPWCVVLIPLLAAPTALALGWVVRRMAPTRLALAGAGIGAAAGGVGAVAYVMRLPDGHGRVRGHLVCAGDRALRADRGCVGPLAAALVRGACFTAKHSCKRHTPARIDLPESLASVRPSQFSGKIRGR